MVSVVKGLNFKLLVQGTAVGIHKRNIDAAIEVAPLINNTG